jgi:hypothetical protein
MNAKELEDTIADAWWAGANTDFTRARTSEELDTLGREAISYARRIVDVIIKRDELKVP